jgi:diaminohydroxyphosphoribosylaminopyrimidine deaminase/5-amino-6-(5-phosphoribosylamino)uracil reductase
MQAEVDRIMRQALMLAKKARGKTFPNPLVGALIVKDQKIIATGFHRKAGGTHAEILALKEAGGAARGAALYCTFEPCAHFGRTGPCVDEIIKAGIKEVFIGMVDPNPLTRGRGIRKLKRHGLRVKVGFLEEAIAAVNRPFIKAMTTGLPLVTIKFAESLDGKIATSAGESKWITHKESRRTAHEMRRFFDGIMVGIRTVCQDDPGLETLKNAAGHRLMKIIVDSTLRIPLTAKLLKTKQPVIIASVKRNKRKELRLRAKGADVVITKSKNGRVDLRALLKELHQREIRSVLVEGGSELIGSFMDERLADRACVFVAPSIIGGRRALGPVGGYGIRKLAQASRLAHVSMKKIEGDILIEGDLKYS